MMGINNFNFHVTPACILIQARWLWSTWWVCTQKFTNFLWKRYIEHILNSLLHCVFLWVFWGGKRVVQFFIHPHPSYSDINKWEPFEVDKVRWSTITGATSSRSISKKTSGRAGWDSCAAWRLPRCHDFWWLQGWYQCYLQYPSSKLLHFIILMIGFFWARGR